MSDGMTLLARCLVKCQYSGYWPLVATILQSRFEYKHAQHLTCATFFLFLNVIPWIGASVDLRCSSNSRDEVVAFSFGSEALAGMEPSKDL